MKKSVAKILIIALVAFSVTGLTFCSSEKEKETAVTEQSSQGKTAEQPGETVQKEGQSTVDHPGDKVGQAGSGGSAEHPGQPAGEKKTEHPGESAAEHPDKPITAASVKQSIHDYVAEQAGQHDGAFLVHDPELHKDWRLKMETIHDPVRKYVKDGQTIYFACSDFKSIDSDDVLDIDLWMVPKGDALAVTEVKIHKLNGEPRFTYEGTEIKPIE